MGRMTAWRYLTDQLATLPPVSKYKSDLAGKTVVVTGGNAGIGLEAAKHFAAMNPARLIIGCRNPQKAEAALELLRAVTESTALETWSLDLANFASVRAFADRFENEGGGHLDLLVENAGMHTSVYETTVDGWEKMIQVNHLGPSLLAILLLPYLLKSPVSLPMPRLVMVASEAHYFVKSLSESKSPKILERLNDKQYCTYSVMMNRYSISKLMNVFFTRSVASRLPTPPTGSLTVTCLSPGFCRTGLFRELRGFMSLIMRFGEFLLARTPEVGSRNIVWAALGGKEGELHGKHVARCRIEEESDFVLSKKGSEIEDRLWKETIEILSKIDPRVTSIVDNHLTTS